MSRGFASPDLTRAAGQRSGTHVSPWCSAQGHRRNPAKERPLARGLSKPSAERSDEPALRRCSAEPFDKLRANGGGKPEADISHILIPAQAGISGGALAPSRLRGRSEQWASFRPPLTGRDNGVRRSPIRAGSGRTDARRAVAIAQPLISRSQLQTGCSPTSVNQNRR